VNTSIRTRALLFVASATLATLGNARAVFAEPSAAQTKSATLHFTRGVDLYNSHKYGPALEQFKASYADVASPNSHLYIARCLAGLGEQRKAYAELEKVIAEAEAKPEKYAQTGEAASLERGELATQLAFVTVRVNAAGESATLSVGGTDVPREQWGKPVPVEPGRVVVLLTPSASDTSIARVLNLVAGDKKDVTMSTNAGNSERVSRDAVHAEKTAPTPTAELPPETGTSTEPETTPAAEEPSHPKSGLRAAAFVSGGVGLVGLGLFAAEGVMVNSAYSTLQSECGTKPCPASRKDEVDSAKSKQTIANIGLAIGGVGVATGVVLFLLSRGGEKPQPAAVDHVVLGPTYAGYRGTF
jgi:hypothetical protein